MQCAPLLTSVPHPNSKHGTWPVQAPLTLQSPTPLYMGGFEKHEIYATAYPTDIFFITLTYKVGDMPVAPSARPCISYGTSGWYIHILLECFLVLIENRRNASNYFPFLQEIPTHEIFIIIENYFTIKATIDFTTFHMSKKRIKIAWWKITCVPVQLLIINQRID